MHLIRKSAVEQRTLIQEGNSSGWGLEKEGSIFEPYVGYKEIKILIKILSDAPKETTS